jgi:hypothetical protein
MAAIEDRRTENDEPDEVRSVSKADGVPNPNGAIEDENEIVREIGSDYAEKYGFHNSDNADNYFFKSGRGLSHELVEAISEHKN